ncbi:MAG: hypothetical protein M0R80_20020 [Proteobacteria bacterium]|jgi:hypothetical protein|nr:hypothetical protein [Pseudomonadota bacterium]
MNRRVLSCVFFAAVMSVFAISCGDDDSGGGLITLSAVIADPCPVALGVTNGTMTFDFSAQPLEMAQADDLQTVLYSGGIGLTVASTDTGVSYELTEGTAVSDTPNAVGEYNVAAAEDGTSVTVTFYNSFDGYTINTSNTYTATITVIENGYFTVETFTRGVAL